MFVSKMTAAAMALMLSAAALAQGAATEGEVRKVDAATGKITLKHDGIKNLEMPGMTMAFPVKNPAWLANLQPGQKVSFTAEKVNGQITVTSLTPK
jgi:Cu(I)/Ag(I) efflux system periplasmic protein CusF